MAVNVEADHQFAVRYVYMEVHEQTPIMVMEDWHALLTDRLERAFLSVDQGDQANVYHTMTLEMSEGGDQVFILRWWIPHVPQRQGYDFIRLGCGYCDNE